MDTKDNATMYLNSERKKTVQAFVFLVAVALTMFACLQSPYSAAAASSKLPIPKKDLLLVVSVINTTNPYMISNINGGKALSKELDIPLKIVNSNNSSQTEISKIQAILASSEKTVLMFVNTVASPDAVPIVDAVKRAGGYVTIWWNKPRSFKPSDVGDHFVAFQKIPGVQSGRCGADSIGHALNGEGDVVILPGVKDSTTSKTRVAGFRAELKEKFPDIKILASRPSNWDPQIAHRNAQNLIAKYGDEIDAVYTADDAMQIGAMQAFESAGLLEQVKFASDGLYPKTVADMKSGRGDNAIVGETFHRGFMASAVALYTAYLAAEEKIEPTNLPHKKRESLFKLSCVTPQNFNNYIKYDSPNARKAFVDRLVKDGPWNTAPMPLVGAAPEKLPKP